MAEKLSGFKAINLALQEMMTADEKVVCVGEDIGPMGGCWGYFGGLFDKFGADRVVQTPICETGYTGVACGMAYGGYRPVVEYMFADFVTLAFDGIVNCAAKARYNSNGVLSMPITFMLPEGGGGKSGCQHSQSVEAWFANIPGLKIVAPTTPGDVRAFLKASIAEDDPVLFVFARSLLGLSEEVDLADATIPSIANAAKIVKEGSDLTVIAWHRALVRAIEAAKEVEAETGKSIEIIDPRVLEPFDREKVFASVRKTGRAMVAHEAPERGGYGTLISAWIAENCLTDLKIPVHRVGGHNTCIPFGKVEEYAYPQVEDIKAGMLKALQG